MFFFIAPKIMQSEMNVLNSLRVYVCELYLVFYSCWKNFKRQPHKHSDIVIDVPRPNPQYFNHILLMSIYLLHFSNTNTQNLHKHTYLFPYIYIYIYQIDE